MEIRSILNKYWLLLSFVLIFISEFLMNFQTIGMSDEGYYLSTYQFFFVEPRCNEGGFLFYLTSMIGAIWNTIFGWGGILSFRLLWIIISCLTFYFVYRIFEDYTEYKWWLLFSFLLINVGFFPGVFSNKCLSVFLGTVSLYFLYTFFRNNKLSGLFLGAFILSLNVFVRIPNIVILALLPMAIIIHRLYCQDKTVSFFKMAIISTAGILMGVALMACVLFALGHVHFFIDALKDMFADGASSEASHNYYSMILFYIRDYMKVLLCFILFSFFYIINRRYNANIKISSWFFAALLIMIVVLFLCISPNRFKYSYLFIGLAIALSVFYYNKENDMVLKCILLSSFAYVVLQPIGTDYGNAIWGTLSTVVFLPAGIIIFQRFLQGQSKAMKYYSNLVLVVLGLTIMIVRFNYTIIDGSWADHGHRFSMRFYVNESPLATTCTTKERAFSLDELLKEGKKHFSKYDYLFCYMSIPLVNYLTQTKPYLHCSSSAYYTPDIFKKQLLQAQIEKKQLPVVVCEKNLKGWSGWEEKESLFKSFLSSNQYVMVWNNKDYCIYLPQRCLLNE